jgi:D-alanyl-D-alanine carboxypeptidase
MRKLFFLFITQITVFTLSAGGVFFFPASAVAQRVQAALIADADSGYVLYADKADEKIYPASLTKLMTLYLTFQALENGVLRMEDELLISQKAAAKPASKIYLKPETTLTVKEAILALIVKSANDVAAVLGESLAGSEEQFAEMMTKAAHDLGMNRTVFKNASGLYHKQQISTARDMAVLALALINHFPQYYPLFTTKVATIQGKIYGNHNNIIRLYKGAEGLKTGYLNACGYHVITTCRKKDMRLVAVSLGQSSVKSRDASIVSLLDKGFAKMEELRAAQKNNTSNENPFKQRPILNETEKKSYLPKMRTSVQLMKESILSLKNTRQISLPEKKTAGLANQKITLPLQEDNESYWQVQAGAYASLPMALKKAGNIEQLLKETGIVQILPFKDLWRVRVFGLENEKKAQEVSRLLQKNKLPCFIISPKNHESQKAPDKKKETSPVMIKKDKE